MATALLKSDCVLMHLLRLLISSVVIFFVLYAPQPILPLLSTQFSVSPATAGSLMTATMLPLAIAPLFYGLFLTRQNPLKILKITMILLAISCGFVPYINSFEYLFSIRLIQGFLLPAALTAMTTYIGKTYKNKQLQRNMTLYIASTIVGGFFGRVLSASFAELLQWQDFYFVMAITLCIFALFIKIDKDFKAGIAVSILSHLKDVKHPRLIKTYCAVFCMFFCFAAILNYLPFILRDNFAIKSTQNIGLVYIAYLIGALASILSPWLVKKSPNTFSLLSGIFVIYCCSIVMMLPQNFISFFIAFAVFCGAMFIIHSIAAPLVNRISNATASVTNGLYVSFYYSGGALGSYLPGLVYQGLGQQVFLLLILSVCLIGLGLVYSARAGTEIT